ncbi:hypothetical protein [Neisseria lactamica]|nr:hypothetical protein [Neisseria lactamica]
MTKLQTASDASAGFRRHRPPPSECEACPQGTALPTHRQSATPTRKENQ